jgi:hypothetical protein
MRSKGSRFILGGWGLRGCWLDVAFMFATGRNRPQPSATGRASRMAVPMVSSEKLVTFGGCTCRVASFRVACVALRDIPTCFVRCRKSFFVAGPILLRRFQKMRCSFRGGSLARNARFEAPTDVSRLESLVFLWPRRAYGKFCKRGHFWILVEVAHVALLRFAWHAWHFVTSRRVL